MRCKKSVKECLSGNKKIKKALQAEKTDQSPCSSFFVKTRKVFLWILPGGKICRKASLTVEAAMVLPIFILTVSTILGILDSYRIQALIKTSLHQSAMELGMYAYGMEQGMGTPVGNIASASVCMAYARNKMPDLGENVQLSFIETTCKNGEITLRVKGEYRLPVTLLPIPVMKFYNEAKVNSWIGWDASRKISDSEKSDMDMVYIAENESVYHTSPWCTHINLSIHTGWAENMRKLRNEYGEKYVPCEKCGGGKEAEIVYYTETGNRYHTSENCSGLKRTVHIVKKSEVSHIHQCQRCREKNEP